MSHRKCVYGESKCDMKGTDQHFGGEVGHMSSLACQLPLTRTNSPIEFLLESGRHNNSLARVSLTLRYILMSVYHTDYTYFISWWSKCSPYNWFNRLTQLTT